MNNGRKDDALKEFAYFLLHGEYMPSQEAWKNIERTTQAKGWKMEG
jgi:hypothetical protein